MGRSILVNVPLYANVDYAEGPSSCGNRGAQQLLDELADATLDGTRQQHLEILISVPLLIIDDLEVRKLLVTAAEDLLEIVMRRRDRASSLLTSNSSVEYWGKMLGDRAAVTDMLDRLLHHGHVLTSSPPSCRTKTNLPSQEVARLTQPSPGHSPWPVLK